MHQQNEQMKFILQHIQLKSLMPTPHPDPPSSDDIVDQSCDGGP